ncbi:hypothetical protein [Sphingomonas mollis]|uniref:Small CPxCG-related zinc finger protein n=1 Tax=Sphingomonas mollis TaxID=2795726 RepID=A0ABS0XLH2_9SPHN|nr:hypothetical protein [Sphingomonas sp. BT553]MBJ6120894.1 hypothetical protein [Sphingomonas sp. BT553]
MSQDTYSTDAPECPYCGYKQSHDGGYLYDEDLTEIDCGSCDRTFNVEVYVSTSWTCRPRHGA